MRHYLAPSQLFQLLMHGLGDFQDVLISVGAPWWWCYAAMVKYEDFFYLGSWYSGWYTSKKNLLQSLSVFLKRCGVIFFPIHVLLFGDFLSYSYLTFCVHFRYVQPELASAADDRDLILKLCQLSSFSW